MLDTSGRSILESVLYLPHVSSKRKRVIPCFGQLFCILTEHCREENMIEVFGIFGTYFGQPQLGGIKYNVLFPVRTQKLEYPFI